MGEPEKPRLGLSLTCPATPRGKERQFDQPMGAITHPLHAARKIGIRSKVAWSSDNLRHGMLYVYHLCHASDVNKSRK